MKAKTPPPIKHPYRLVEMRVSDFKKIKAIAIKPDRSLFNITGKNEQGKSSLLDAVSAAIGGKDAFPSAPVRKGQEKAEIFLDFGGVKMTRTIRAQDGGGVTHSVKIEYADGTKPKEKQDVLDTLRGSPIADDPLAFARMKPKDRFDMIRGLVDFDFESNAETRKDLFEDRTQVGRDLERANAAVQNMKVEGDAPAAVDITELMTKLRAANDHNEQVRTRSAGRATAAQRIEDLKDQIDVLTGELTELQRKLETADPLPAPIDVTSIEKQIASADEINAKVRIHAERVAKVAERDRLDRQYENLTSDIDDIDDLKKSAIRAAKLPIENLTFGDNDIMIDGLPFDVASTARKIRVATALLMALKPDLRVLLVREGSLLDDDARAALEADAVAHDFVVLMETVDEDVDSTGGVVIEDGMVAS